jgi:hypothetical protein
MAGNKRRKEASISLLCNITPFLFDMMLLRRQSDWLQKSQARLSHVSEKDSLVEVVPVRPR